MSTVIKLNTKAPSNSVLYQISELFLATDYYEYLLLGNSLAIDVRKIIEKCVILPNIQYTSIVLDDLQNVAGSYLGAEMKKLILNKENAYYRDDPSVNILAKAYDKLYEKIADKDFYLSNFAVRVDLRGIIYPSSKNKIADILFKEILLEARSSGCGCLQLFTWKSHTPARRFYHRYHGVVVESVDLSHTVYSDTLLRIKIDL